MPFQLCSEKKALNHEYMCKRKDNYLRIRTHYTAAILTLLLSVHHRLFEIYQGIG